MSFAVWRPSLLLLFGYAPIQRIADDCTTLGLSLSCSSNLYNLTESLTAYLGSQSEEYNNLSAITDFSPWSTDPAFTKKCQNNYLEVLTVQNLGPGPSPPCCTMTVLLRVSANQQTNEGTALLTRHLDLCGLHYPKNYHGRRGSNRSKSSFFSISSPVLLYPQPKVAGIPCIFHLAK